MATNKIALQDMTAEQEADRLLAEEDATRTGGGGSGMKANDDAFKADLQDLEESESLPHPVTSNQTTAVCPSRSHRGLRAAKGYERVEDARRAWTESQKFPKPSKG